MAKSSAGSHSKAAVAGMVLIRVFLGVFFLFSASAKFITFAGESDAPRTMIPASPVPAANTTAAVSPATQPAVTPPATRVVPPPATEPGGLSPKLFIDELHKVTMPDGDFTRGNILPQYAAYLQNVVSPHAGVFGWLVIIGEAAVGLFLLIGMFTRLAALIAMIISIAYLLATMHLYPPLGLAANSAFLAMEFSVFASNAGKTAGFDGIFGRKAKNDDDD